MLDKFLSFLLYVTRMVKRNYYYFFVFVYKTPLTRCVSFDFFFLKANIIFYCIYCDTKRRNRIRDRLLLYFKFFL